MRRALDNHNVDSSTVWVPMFVSLGTVLEQLDNETNSKTTAWLLLRQARGVGPAEGRRVENRRVVAWRGIIKCESGNRSLVE